MSKIILYRHQQTAPDPSKFEPDPKLVPDQDELSAQMVQAANLPRGCRLVAYRSDTQRTRQTMHNLRRAFEKLGVYLPEEEIRKGLRERDFGELYGQSLDAIKSQFFIFPFLQDGQCMESSGKLTSRSRKEMNFLSGIAQGDKVDTVIVVGHGNSTIATCSAYLARFYGMEGPELFRFFMTEQYTLPFGACVEFGITGGRVYVKSMPDSMTELLEKLQK